MKKYAIPGTMLLAGHEVVSLIALILAVAMFLADIGKAADERGGF